VGVLAAFLFIMVATSAIVIIVCVYAPIAFDYAFVQSLAGICSQLACAGFFGWRYWRLVREEASRELVFPRASAPSPTNAAQGPFAAPTTSATSTVTVPASSTVSPTPAFVPARGRLAHFQRFGTLRLRPHRKPQLPRDPYRAAITLALCVLVGICLQTFVSSLLTIIEALNPDMLAEYAERMDEMTQITPLSTLSLVILAPLSEELTFRGVCLTYGLRVSPRAEVGAVLSAMAFGIAHLDPVQGIYVTFIGLVFGLVALRGGGLIASMTLHFGLNLSSYFVGYILAPFMTLYIPGLILASTLSLILSIVLVTLILRLVTPYDSTSEPAAV
jgi:membrane protease YdiL (CAAX protease family)